MNSYRCFILLVAGLLAFTGFSGLDAGSNPVASPLTSQDDKKKDDEKDDEKDEDPDEGEDEDAKRPSGYTVEQEEAIAKHFHANTAEFQKNGRLRLVYEFEDEDAIRLMDFSPAMEETDKHVRWALRNDTGLMIAEYGQFVHNAEWLADVKMNVSGTCYSQFAPGDVFVAGLIEPKKGRDMIGTNVGAQCIKLKGMRPSDALPRSMPELRVEQKVNFGFELELGILYCLKNERRISISTEKKPKFTRKFDRGRVGIRWQKHKGHVQFCLYQFVIEGRLDPKWVEKEIF